MAENDTPLPDFGITLMGLGPGDIGSLTREAWDWILSIDTLYIRTMAHPIVDALPNGLALIGFDDILDQNEEEDAVSTVVETIFNLGLQPGGVTYAVPGHPLVGEATCEAILRRAKQREIPCRVIDGLSFLGADLSRLGRGSVREFEPGGWIDFIQVTHTRFLTFQGSTDHPDLIRGDCQQGETSAIGCISPGAFRQVGPCRRDGSAGNPGPAIGKD